MLLLLSTRYLHKFSSMEGGELFQRIQDRPDGKPFTERGNVFHGSPT